MPERTIIPGTGEQRTAERQAALQELALEREVAGDRPWDPGRAADSALAELRAGRQREAASAAAYGAAAGLPGTGGPAAAGMDPSGVLQARQAAYYSALNSLTGDLGRQLAVAEGDTWTSFQQYLDEALERLQYGGVP